MNRCNCSITGYRTGCGRLWPIHFWPMLVVGGPGLHTTSQELQTCTFQGPGASNTNQISTRKHPEREKERKWWLKREKKARNFGPPTLWGPTLRSPTFSGFGPFLPPPPPLRSHPSSGTPIWIGPGVDWPKVDWPKVDGPKVDGPKVDGPKVDGPKVDGPKMDWPKMVLAKTKMGQIGFAKIGQIRPKRDWPKSVPSYRTRPALMSNSDW